MSWKILVVKQNFHLWASQIQNQVKRNGVHCHANFDNHACCQVDLAPRTLHLPTAPR